LTIGTSSLALITALVAVIGSTAQNLVRQFEPDDKLAIDVLASTSDDLSVRLVNQGDRSIVLTRLVVHLSGRGFTMRHYLAPLEHTDVEVVLDPGDKTRARFTQFRGALFAEPGLTLSDRWPDASTCSLEAKFIGAGGLSRERSWLMDCNGSMKEFLSSRWSTSKVAGPIPMN
jgi:hypothetical protein